MDFTANAYLTVALRPASSYQTNPSSLTSLFPGMEHVGPVGALPDVQVVSVPRAVWERDGAGVLAALNGADGVLRVDVQEQRQRRKRDEF